MPRGIHKSNLPTKICLTCHKSFTRRKKRESNRDDVKYCSHKCKTDNTSARLSNHIN